MRRDRISNERIINLLAPERRLVGGFFSASIDMMTSQVVAGGTREAHTNMLLAVLMGANWDVGGTINITVQHSNDNATWVNHSTIAQMLQTEGEDIYLAEVKDFRRYVRLWVIVATAAATFAIVGSADRSRRERVYQEGTEKAVTEVIVP